MSKTILSVSLMFILLGACKTKQDIKHNNSGVIQADTGKPVITFTLTEHDFGEMIQGESLSHVFVFKNTGTGNLLIRSASSSCGCTVPRYDKIPIAPGDSGRMEVVFNSAGKMGKQHKTIAVRANTDPPVTLLTIYADVKEKN